MKTKLEMRTNKCLALAMLLMLFLVGCRHSVIEVSLNTQLASLNEQEYGANEKSYFVDEKYVYWEADDKIVVKPGASPMTISSLKSGADTQDGEFSVRVEEGQYNSFCGLFPAIDGNEITGEGSYSVTCNLPSTQEYYSTCSASASGSDFTFSKNGLPMVAYSASSTPNLRFYTPCGVLRLQLYNSGSDPINLQSIELTSVESGSYEVHNLSGVFSVVDYNTISPKMVVNGTGSPTVTLSCGTSGVVLDNAIKSFYVVLPAYKTSVNTVDNRTSLKLRIKFTDSAGRSFTGYLTTLIAANTITKTRAIDVGTSTPSTGIAGNGTKQRPFQIYNIDDLIKVKNACPSGTLNGRSLTTSETDTIFFALSRNNIELTTANWNTKGIELPQYCAFAGNEYSIKNNSNFPIFTSNAGVVHNLKVTGICGADSPLCSTNNGTLILCQNDASPSVNHDWAGICYTNNGTITQCSNGSASLYMQMNNNVKMSGICTNNNGTIKESFNNCKLEATAGKVSGICFNNNGSIITSYNNASLIGNEVSGICHTNASGKTISKCFLADNNNIVIRSNSTIGVICHTNSGNIYHCYSFPDPEMWAVAKVGIGGICYQNNTDAVIDSCEALINCRNSQYSTTAKAGGVVCLNQGVVRNCYNEGSIGDVDSTYIAGGIAAENSGSIINNYNRGYVYANNTAGGVMGTNSATVNNVYNTGDISATNVGGIAGSGSSDITNAYYLENCTSGTTVNTVGTSKTDSEMKDAAFVTTLNNNVSGNDYFSWKSGNPYPEFDK